MFCWLSPMCMYLAHFGCRWPFLKQGEQTLEGRSGSLCQYFDTAVALVACITTQPKCEGSVHNEIAVADSLNPSMYISMDFLNVIGFVLACHGLHISILWLFSP